MYTATRQNGLRFKQLKVNSTKQSFLLLKAGKFNCSACSFVGTFSVVKKTEVIGRNGRNRAKEKLMYNFGHRISKNHNFGTFAREKGYY